MKKKWIVTAYILAGVLIPIPINMLARYFIYLESRTFIAWYRVAQLALTFFSYFFLGAYVALFKSLKSRRMLGRWRIRWPEFALGAILFAMGFLMKLQLATGAITMIDFIHNSDVLYTIFNFNDGLYTWVILAGFFMADAFEKIPLKEEARADGPQPDERVDGEQPTT